LLILSKSIITGIKKVPAIAERSITRVIGGIADASFCATNAIPQIIAAMNNNNVDRYFFIININLCMRIRVIIA
jgi:hypothetical protein